MMTAMEIDRGSLRQRISQKFECETWYERWINRLLSSRKSDSSCAGYSERTPALKITCQQCAGRVMYGHTDANTIGEKRRKCTYSISVMGHASPSWPSAHISPVTLLLMLSTWHTRLHHVGVLRSVLQ